MEKNKKGSAFNFPVGTDYDSIAAKLNAHYADKLRSPVGWYGTATANIAGDENTPEKRVKFARTTAGWDVYELAGSIGDRVTVETGKFQPVGQPVTAPAAETPAAETVPPVQKPKRNQK
jgi:hypothetical protein